ncbi:sigma-70 family RNA polymerase sigma factor [Kaarinaea lacus]
MNRVLSIATGNMTSSGSDEYVDVDDVGLMTYIAEGDRNAFNVFLSRHLSALVQFCRRYLFNLADAEDIAQETFIRVWQKAVTWKPQGHSPRSWVYRIGYNLCIDELRRRSANPSSNNVDDDPNIEYATSNLEQSLELDSDLDRLTRLLNLLPERQRTALSLCALQGLTNREAANAMDISVEALESLLSRGRRQLRISLKQDDLLQNGESHNE